jgi:hypothetical protein
MKEQPCGRHSNREFDVAEAELLRFETAVCYICSPYANGTPPRQRQLVDTAVSYPTTVGTIRMRFDVSSSGYTSPSTICEVIEPPLVWHIDCLNLRGM